MKPIRQSAWVAVALLGSLSWTPALVAQPPSDRGERGGFRGGEGGERGERGGRFGGRGERGGDRGEGGRGGPPGGGFSGRGGPPGGGFPGGGFPGGGGPPGGGFPGGGGPPGGGRGGFDPASFIERLDTNGNGMIDPDEMQGPARFMVSRLQREDPSIRSDGPIPVAKFKEAFERMRSGGEGGDSGRSRGGRGDTEAQLAEAMSTAPLVPGFGGEVVALEPVLGFGPSAELSAVPVTPADRKEAEERLARYDRNKDGYLSGDEISRRWTGNPMDFDRNGDGKLSVSELAVRAARLRVAQQEVAETNDRRDGDRRRERGEQTVEIPDPYNGRQSFATISRGLPEGLPSWFADKDTDGDQQVSMAEFSSRWTPALVDEFRSFDLNGDGFVTPQECLAAVRGGATAGSSGSSRGDDSPSMSRYSGRSSRGSSEGPRAPGPAPAAVGGTPDERTMEMATRIIGRNDQDKNGFLTADEWREMLVDPSAADANGDGKITALEYAQWTESRQRSR